VSGHTPLKSAAAEGPAGVDGSVFPQSEGSAAPPGPGSHRSSPALVRTMMLTAKPCVAR